MGALASLFADHHALAAPVSAQPKETLVWLKRDLPPLFIFDGPEKGQGVIDQLLRQLIAGMPQYQHSVLKVNRARGLQMLHEPALTCDAALNWSKERESWIAFSLPVFRAMSNGLAVRRNDREVLTPFLKDGEVDLAALLATGTVTLGIVAERNYGEYLDALLKQAPGKVLTLHYGNDALGSLLQMQRLGRLQLLLGYRPEIRYQAQQQGIAEEELQFYPDSWHRQIPVRLHRLHQYAPGSPGDHRDQPTAACPAPRSLERGVRRVARPAKSQRLPASGQGIFRASGRLLTIAGQKETPRSGETTRG